MRTTRLWQKWRFSAPQINLWLIKVWFSASIPIGIGMVKIATFAKPETVTSHSKITLQTNKNIPFYLTTIGLFILLKFGYKLADNDNLIFLLKPTDQIVGLLTGSHSIYFSDKGYYHDSLNILIEKSCSGFNFMLLCFCMLTFLFLKHSNNKTFKILSIPVSLIVSYVLTIFVNASRIFVSIIMQQQVSNILIGRSHLILHEIVGVITNLTFLILIYSIAEKSLTKKFPDAKLT